MEEQINKMEEKKKAIKKEMKKNLKKKLRTKKKIVIMGIGIIG